MIFDLSLSHREGKLFVLSVCPLLRSVRCGRCAVGARRSSFTAQQKFLGKGKIKVRQQCGALPGKQPEQLAYRMDVAGWAALSVTGSF